MENNFEIGDYVKKVTGDYQFEGIIIMKGSKWNQGSPAGPTRYVVQNGSGLLHIFGPSNLELIWSRDEYENQLRKDREEQDEIPF